MKTTHARKRFDWYWDDQFSNPKSPDYFDRSHWWLDRPEEISAEASWYELLRRHPSLPHLEAGESSLRTFMIRHGRKPWPQVDGRSWFRGRLSELDCSKGRDFRFRVLNLTEHAEGLADLHGAGGAITWDTAEDAREWLLVRLTEEMSLVRPEKDAAWRQRFLSYLQTCSAIEGKKGNLIISVSRDIASKGIPALGREIAGVYAAWQKQNKIAPRKAGRDTTKEWLGMISNFEQSEQKRLFDESGRRRAVPGRLKENQKERMAFQGLFEGIAL